MYNARALEQFKKLAHRQYPGEQLPMAVDLLTGSLAGAIAGAATTPLDLMKTLLQTQQSRKKTGRPSSVPTETSTTPLTAPPPPGTPGPKHYSGIIDGMVWNYKNHGLAGLFRGIGPRVFWTSLQSAIMFVIYEQILHIEEALRSRGEWPPSEAAAKRLKS